MRRFFEGLWEAGEVAVWLDPAALPGTAEEATAVVDAVLAASSADELDWIEWKCSLDLSNKAVRGTLARHILGMANRMPETAAGHADGRGFMAVGAEPGDRRGITAADPADLSQGIDAFQGADRPSGGPPDNPIPVASSNASAFGPPMSCRLARSCCPVGTGSANAGNPRFSGLASAR
jgi:hypothetical protein